MVNGFVGKNTVRGFFVPKLVTRFMRVLGGMTGSMDLESLCTQMGVEYPPSIGLTGPFETTSFLFPCV